MTHVDVAKLVAEVEARLNEFVLTDRLDALGDFVESVAASAGVRLLPSATDPGWSFDGTHLTLRVAPPPGLVSVTLNLADIE